MSFADIERVIGLPLPLKAKESRAWWSNNPSNNVMTKVWLGAGYMTERVDIASRRLVFRRAKAGVEWPPQHSSAPTEGERIHPAFGCMQGTVTIAPGVDLTEPLWLYEQDGL